MILLFPFGSAGDVLPFIWLGRKLLARGHRVRMASASMFEDMARAAGIDFTPVGTREEFEAIQRHPGIWKPYQATQIVARYAADNTLRIRDVIAGIAAEEKPALMLAPLTAFGVRLAREEMGIPLVTVHLQPSVMLSMHDTPVFLSEAPWLSTLPRWLKRPIFAATNPLDRCALPGIRKACQQARVAPPRRVMPDWCESPDGVLLLFPEWFAAPQPDWPANSYQHTFPLEDLAAERPLEAGLTAFLTEGDKPIVFTPGTANVQAHRFFDSALGAVRMLGRRAVFATQDLGQIPAPLPPTVFATEYAPFSTLLPRASAFVHHGGIGTLSQGLAAGVPQLLMPLAHDQPDNENRLRRLGAGFGLAPRKFTAPAVAAALERLTSDPSIAAACADCADRLRSAQNAGGMLDWVEARMKRTATIAGAD